MAAKLKALQQWCKIRCEGYRDVSITNMTSSWKSGLAFCAIIHRYRPDLVNYDDLKKENVYENCKLAFDVALENLGIPALLDPEDMIAMAVPDKLCIITYVAQYYNYFHNKPMCGGPGVKSASLTRATKRPPLQSLPTVPSAEDENVGSEAKNKKISGEPISSLMNDQEVTTKRSTLDDKCFVCRQKIYLLERHYVGGKLCHRSCHRDSEKASTLKRLAEQQLKEEQQKEIKQRYLQHKEQENGLQRGHLKQNEQQKGQQVHLQQKEVQELYLLQSDLKQQELSQADRQRKENKENMISETRADVTSPSNHLIGYEIVKSEDSRATINQHARKRVSSPSSPSGLLGQLFPASPVFVSQRERVPSSSDNELLQSDQKSSNKSYEVTNKKSFELTNNRSAEITNNRSDEITNNRSDEITNNRSAEITNNRSIEISINKSADHVVEGVSRATIVVPRSALSNSAGLSYTPSRLRTTGAQSPSLSTSITPSSNAVTHVSNEPPEVFKSAVVLKPECDRQGIPTPSYAVTSTTVRTMASLTTPMKQTYYITSPIEENVSQISKTISQSASPKNVASSTSAISHPDVSPTYVTLAPISTDTPTRITSLCEIRTAPNSSGLIRRALESDCNRTRALTTFGVNDQENDINKKPAVVLSDASDRLNNAAVNNIKPSVELRSTFLEENNNNEMKPAWMIEAESRISVSPGVHVDISSGRIGLNPPSPSKEPTSSTRSDPITRVASPTRLYSRIESEANKRLSSVNNVLEIRPSEPAKRIIIRPPKSIAPAATDVNTANGISGSNATSSTQANIEQFNARMLKDLEISFPTTVYRKQPSAPMENRLLPLQQKSNDPSRNQAPADSIEQLNSFFSSAVVMAATATTNEAGFDDVFGSGVGSPKEDSDSRRKIIPGTTFTFDEEETNEKSRIVPGRVFSVDGVSGELPDFEDTTEQVRNWLEINRSRIDDNFHVPMRQINAEKRMAATVISTNLEKLDKSLRKVEQKGRDLEDRIRNRQDEEMDDDKDVLMIKWFQLVKQRYELIREETDLIYRRRQQDLEDLHAEIEHQLRILLKKRDDLSYSEEDVHLEEVLLHLLENVVSERNGIVDFIERDRLRYIEEDKDIDEMLQSTGLSGSDGKKSKKKTKEDGDVTPIKSFLRSLSKKKSVSEVPESNFTTFI